MDPNAILSSPASGRASPQPRPAKGVPLSVPMPEEPRPAHPTADQIGEHSPVGAARDPTAGDGHSGEKATEAAQDVDMADARPDGKSGVDEAPGHSGNSAGSNTVASRDVRASRPEDDSAAVTNRSFLKQWVQACSPMMELTQLFLQYVSQEPELDGFVPDAVLYKTRLCTRKIKPPRSDLRRMCKHASHQNQARQEGAAKTNFPQQAATAATRTVQTANLPLPSAAQPTGASPQKSISSPKPAQARQTRSLAAATHTAAGTAAASAQEAAPAPATAAAAAPVGPAAAAASQPPRAAAAENAVEKRASASAEPLDVGEAPESLAVPHKRGRAKGRKAGTAAAARDGQGDGQGDGQAEKAAVVEAGQPAVQPSTGAPVEAVSLGPLLKWLSTGEI